MREPHGFLMKSGIWGLGTILYVQAPHGDFVFGHDGANEPAINASVRINPETSDAFVMLVSGHPSLASSIGSEWVLWQTGYPDFLSTDRAPKSALFPILVGSLVILLLLLAVYMVKFAHTKAVDRTTAAALYTDDGGNATEA